jgi:hypothetical protein
MSARIIKPARPLTPLLPMSGMSTTAVERQPGYKHAKYLMRIEVTGRLDGFGRGKGGFWEDRGYEWYAGI